jgi:hypothetical protein
MRKFILAIAHIFLATQSTAQDLSLENCTSFDDDDLRLICYDTISGYEKPESTSSSSDDGTTASGGVGWVFVEEADEFSGKETSYVYLLSDAVDERTSDKPRNFVIRCNGKGGKEVAVVTHGYIGGDRIKVRYKFGDGDPISEKWHASTNGVAAFLPSGYKDFLRGIISGQDFIFEVTDYNGSTALARFENASSGVAKRDYVLRGCKN